MRSGWQQTPARGDQRHAPFGPEVSWPTGYYDLDPYQGENDGRPAGEMPYGEHPYAATQGYDGSGYGDPGYSDPQYEGPSSAGTTTPAYGTPQYGTSGYGSSGYGSSGYDEPGRLGNEWSGAYPTLPGAANDPRYDDPRLDAFGTGAYPEPAGYGPQGYSEPAGYVGYDQPAGYGEPAGYVEAPRRRDETRFDMPVYNETPQLPDSYAGGYDHDATRYDMPVLGAPVIESSEFDVDVYRDPDFQDYATGTGPQPMAYDQPSSFFGEPASFGEPGGFGEPTGFGEPAAFEQPAAFQAPPMRREQVLPHTGMMMAIPTGQLALDPVRTSATDMFDGRILEKTGALEAVFDAGPDSWAPGRDSLTDTMLDMQGAAFLQQTQVVEAPAPAVPLKRTGKRRNGSRDHRQWIAIGAIVVVAAGAVAGVVKFAFPSGGPAHQIVTPTSVTAFTSKPDLEQQMGVPALVDKVRTMSNGQATDLASAVYQEGSVSPGSTAQIFLFIGGHLNNADPSASIASFQQQYPAAKVVSAGSMGGEAACVEVQAGSQGNAAECIWFDNDSFGQMVSSTMNTAALEKVMVSVRPDLERVVKS
ncbi:MAG: hypothetical protein ABSA93_35405 [Streptosporangiaceae bacterium]|jgi:hypothetical protein